MEPTNVTLVPHTHWDREWYAPFDEFSERLVAMMDVLLDLADEGFPHFHLDGQTAMIDDYLERRPERAADVARHVRNGRLSAGPWFTQMDEFLASGESHIRNLERGLARARSLGRALEVGYMPDQFGHIGQMPQILRMSGVDRAVVWRGVPHEIESDSFWWEAPDGSRVLTEYLAFGYFNASAGGRAFDRIEDPAELAEAMEVATERQRPFAASDRILVMLGYDHAGPDATFPARLEAARPSLHTVEAAVGGLEDHLRTQRPTADPPVWKGELRSGSRAHLLPNVYSARVHQKLERGRVESLIERYAEPLASLVPGMAWPAHELDRAWQLLLWNGAHDSSCGCSHDQVALDVEGRFAEARAIGETIVDRAVRTLGSRSRGPGLLRFNPSPFDRDGIPGLGWRVDAGATVQPEPVALGVGPDGSLLAGGLELRFLDEPDVGDLYTFCWEKEGQTPRPPEEVQIDAGTATLRFDDRLTAVVEVTRREGESFLRVDGVVMNARLDHRLRLHIGLDRTVAGSLAGSPFELVERPLIGEGSANETPSATWPARHVVRAGDVAVLHEGVFEYEVFNGAALAITLLRCVGTISRRTMETRPFPAGPDVATPLAQMIGETAFSIGVLRGGNAGSVHLLREWERFALPMVSAPSTGEGGSAEGRLIDVGGECMLSGIRRVEGDVQVRLWNPLKDRPATASVDNVHRTVPPAAIVTIPSRNVGRAPRRR
jgi:alpha-mannosidase